MNNNQKIRTTKVSLYNDQDEAEAYACTIRWKYGVDDNGKRCYQTLSIDESGPDIQKIHQIINDEFDAEYINYLSEMDAPWTLVWILNVITCFDYFGYTARVAGHPKARWD